MVELLIVIVVIGVLASAILVASSGLVNKSKTNNTRSMLQLVSDAVEQFKRDQTSKPTISSAKQSKGGNQFVSYAARYGQYPPDECEVFTATGLPGSTGPADPSRSLAPGKAEIVFENVPPPWDPMGFFKQGPPKEWAEHRDVLALVVAIDLFSESGSSILDRLPDRNRIPAPAQNGKPVVFLDRPKPGDSNPEPNGSWDPEFDGEIRYIVDDWGNPISYLAQRDWKDGATSNIDSSNHEKWNEASAEMIHLNGGAPIIFSWGPDGKDQLTKDAMEPNAKASLIGDFEDNNDDHVVTNPLNDDNVYANPVLREKLAKGIAQ